jgi:hypothetical protein
MNLLAFHQLQLPLLRKFTRPCLPDFAVQGSSMRASDMHPKQLRFCCNCCVCLQEFKEVSRSKPQDTGITLIPNEANLFIWRALLKVHMQHDAAAHQPAVATPVLAGQ